MKTIIRSLVTILVLLCFGLLPKAEAVSPPPDGGYANFTTAEGQNALFSLTSGAANTAVGWFSLKSVTTGSFNTGVGGGALALNNGDSNTAVGAAALLLNTSGVRNTAIGTGAMVYNDTGIDNTAVGVFALNGNDVGFDNTAIGGSALIANTGGIDNTAVGHVALQSNTTGGGNTAVGNNTLVNVTNTNLNTALGANAGNGVITAENVICIGASGANVSNSCFIGNIYSNVQPIVGTDPDSVTITSSGRLGRGNISSRRYKHDIKPMATASEALYALKPVSFRYNKEYDVTQTLAFGLIAEEVAEVYPVMVGRNPQGEPESVRYDQVNAMLLNEFLKDHRTMQELKSIVLGQQSIIAQQRDSFESRLAEQEKQIKALTSAVEKGNAQLETNNKTPRVAVNER
jgi:hypothetical protein